MAQNLQQLKKRIKTSQSISQITKAMEMIAASKIRRAQAAVEKHNPYERKIMHMVRRILNDKDLYEEIERFAKPRPGKKLIYVITPDKGLCGGLVVNLFKKLDEIITKDDLLVSVGKKAAAYSMKYDYNVFASFNAGSSFPKYEYIYPIIDIAKKFYISGEVSSVSVVYTEFKNLLVQLPVETVIFPIDPKAAFKDNDKAEVDYIFEPSPQQVLIDLMPYYFEVEFYGALMNAYASEQSARMNAMRNARENANEIASSLTNVYNRSRQEKITNEILDLANGQAV